MKHSYTHEGKTYSVVALADGSVLEIRRGDRTFPAKNKADQQRWPSLDAWKATWPAGSTPISFSNAFNPVDCAIIDRFFTLRPNMVLGLPSAHAIRKLKKEIREYEWILKNQYNTNLKLKPYEVENRDWHITTLEKKKQLLATCHTLPFQHAIDNCSVSSPHFYVSHKGIMLPVYFNREFGIVVICEYDLASNRKRKIYRPEELGVTADSTFYRLNKYMHVFVPV
jgi:hypothetical protein